jgi:hypothetical protein
MDVLVAYGTVEGHSPGKLKANGRFRGCAAA